MNPKQQYKLAYRLVRLETYLGETYEQWDYAHNPSDFEVYQADLTWAVVLDCQRQYRELISQIGDSPYRTVAVSNYNHREDLVPLPKLQRVANNFGVAHPTIYPARNDDRDWYIRNWQWHLHSLFMSWEVYRDRREKLLEAARRLIVNRKH